MSLSEILGPPRKNLDHDNEAWQARYDKLEADGWVEGFQLPSRFAVASISVIQSDTAAFLLTTDGRVVLWKYHHDLDLPMFMNVTPTEEDLKQ